MFSSMYPPVLSFEDTRKEWRKIPINRQRENSDNRHASLISEGAVTLSRKTAGIAQKSPDADCARLRADATALGFPA